MRAACFFRFQFLLGAHLPPQTLSGAATISGTANEIPCLCLYAHVTVQDTQPVTLAGGNEDAPPALRRQAQSVFTPIGATPNGRPGATLGRPASSAAAFGRISGSSNEGPAVRGHAFPDGDWGGGNRLDINSHFFRCSCHWLFECSRTYQVSAVTNTREESGEAERPSEAAAVAGGPGPVDLNAMDDSTVDYLHTGTVRFPACDPRASATYSLWASHFCV